jgi:hypothetical protein
MNFARYKCDRRAMQSRMRDDAFSLQARNEGRHPRSRNAVKSKSILFVVVVRSDLSAVAQRAKAEATRQFETVGCYCFMPSVLRRWSDRAHVVPAKRASRARAATRDHRWRSFGAPSSSLSDAEGYGSSRSRERQPGMSAPSYT